MALQDIRTPIVFGGAFVTRLSSSFGINSEPTSVELELVSPTTPTPSDIAMGAVGINVSNLLPGTTTGIAIGAFKFVGLIQNQTEQYSQAGRTYSVKLADPRIVLDNVPLILDKVLPVATTGCPNILNNLNYHGSPKAADLTSQGTTFAKIRDYLSASGTTVLLYNQRYRFQFDSNFQNTGIIPNWYRIPNNTTNINNLLQEVSNAVGYDYYAYVDYDSYVANNTTGVIIFKMINRNQASGQTAINNMITGYTTSGILISYNKGQELRNDPNLAVVLGGNLAQWSAPTVSHGVTIDGCQTYWGEHDDGSALFHYGTPNSVFTPDGIYNYNTPEEREELGMGIVLLNHIVGDYAEAQFTTYGLAEVTYEKIQVQKVASSTGSYPPRINRTVSVGSETGYYPTSNMLRCALISQEAWEAATWHDMNFFAKYVLGMQRSRIYEADEFIYAATGLAAALGPTVDDIRHKLNIIYVGSGVTDRSENSRKFISAVYDATKVAADQYYGRTWIADLPTSVYLSSGSYDASEFVPQIEYTIADSAWSQTGFNVPSGVGNHSTLQTTINTNFRSEEGNIRSFCSLENWEDVGGVNGYFVFPDSISSVALGSLPISTNNLDKSKCIIDQGGNLCVPITCTQYKMAPDRAIITMDQTIEGLMPLSGTFASQPYICKPEVSHMMHFLMAMGYYPSDIMDFGLAYRAGDNESLGIAPPRITKIVSDGTDTGFFIPINYTYKNYGPFTFASGDRFGGVNLIEDPSLVPATYGSANNFYEAGSLLSQKAVSTATYIDSADFALAGLPLFNIGDPIDSAAITSLTMQLGVQGLITNYGLRTFALSNVKVNKRLNDKIIKAFLGSPGKQQEFVVIDQDLGGPFGRGQLFNQRPLKSILGASSMGWVFSQVTR